MAAPRSKRSGIFRLGIATLVVAGAWQDTPTSPSDVDATRWCYRPLTRPAVPEGSARQPIDRFIDARLARDGLRPMPAAERGELLRRLHYDLVGLPPTPEEVAAFVADEHPLAYERKVDELLASPQYGVHQARRWLDLVRWAETDSYERDRNKDGAWHYRDFVVDAMNEDMPFDRFVTLQLAGDEVPEASRRDRIATGYLHLGIRDDEPTDPEQAVYDDLDGMADTTGRVFLGISMGCARCHDHKKDPLPSEDYYRFLAFFENLAPYKVGGGNAITPRNFVQTETVDEGPNGNHARIASFERKRTELRERIARRAARVTSSATALELTSALREGLVSDHSRLVTGGEGGLAVHGAAVHEDTRGPYLHFDGLDDWARIPRKVQDDFTIAFRFRTEHAASGAGFHRWHHGDGLVDGEVPGIVQDFGTSILAGGRISAGCGDPEISIVSQPGYDDGAWHEVAFTRERATGRIALYLDGALCSEATASKAALTTPKELRLGRLAGTNHFFDGDLGDVRIYDRVLTDREIVMLTLGTDASTEVEALVEASDGAEAAHALRADVQAWTRLSKPEVKTMTFLCAKEKRGELAKSYVRIRGNVHAKGKPVEPGFPRMLGGDVLPEIVGTRRSSGRRLALAKWICSDENPLTARVIANRIWQQHFGRGIVRTPNEFGKLGELPTHPALLDWLATELRTNGWSLKHLRRTILLSDAYRRSSRAAPSQLAKDPQNDAFWRFDPRRLTAEEIRDSILAINGTIDLRLGGPSVYPTMPAEVLETSSRPEAAWGNSSERDAARRSLYIFVKRSLLMPFLTAYDLADTDATCPVRFVTTQPTQALTMLNSDFLHEEAGKFARRLEREAESLEDRLRRGLSLVVQRPVKQREVERARTLYTSLVRDHALTDALALERVCLVFLNLNEFIYLD
ncbi:MAG: DUF1553 domain-containing protein [Planctomycetes bacterium]|nr:DUF1553 domain-containing protein [Planctomycetota bacterium]